VVIVGPLPPPLQLRIVGAAITKGSAAPEVAATRWHH